METTGRQRLRFRTRTTGLSDDDIFIRDGLLDGGRLLKNLVQKWFGIQNNMQSHSLKNEELVATLKRSMNLGWILQKTETERGAPGVRFFTRSWSHVDEPLHPCCWLETWLVV